MTRIPLVPLTLCSLLPLLFSGCDRKVTAHDVALAAGTAAAGTGATIATGPVPGAVVPALDAGNFTVDRPELFPLATAEVYLASPEVDATGVVAPDVSRQVPVPSLASGRVVEIDARLGDTVRQGQLLFKVRSTDIAAAFSDYRKAVQNEQLAKVQFDRARLLFDHGAVPRSSLEVAQTAEDNAKVDLETAAEHLRVLGSDPGRPSPIVEVRAPVSGVITDQQVTGASGVQALTPPNPFTISDVSHVWVLCDVWENDLAQVHQGESADIRLNAFPGRRLEARVSNIAQIMDPALHTAKVRLEVENPGLLRFGMFVTAVFHGEARQRHSLVPAAAVLHLHDRDWVFSPAGNGRFRRLEVTAGNILSGNRQEIISGLEPGARVVANALVLENTVER